MRSFRSLVVLLAIRCSSPLPVSARSEPHCRIAGHSRRVRQAGRRLESRQHRGLRYRLQELARHPLHGSTISRGYAQMLDTYRKGYSTKEKMGTLSFTASKCSRSTNISPPLLEISISSAQRQAVATQTAISCS